MLKDERNSERIAEFEAVLQAGTDERIWEEMVFCFFNGGCSREWGSLVEAVKPLLLTGNQAELAATLADGIVIRMRARDMSLRHANFAGTCGLKLRTKLASLKSSRAPRLAFTENV